MATVALEKLVKRYGAVEAVRAIDLEIADGEFVALVGPSGCGKSTTLRMIAGLEEISSGNDPDRRRDRQRPAAPRAQHLHGVPILRALPAHECAREPRLFAQDRQAPEGRDRRPRRRGERHSPSRRSARAPAIAAFRRPAPARRDGAGDRAQARSFPVRRAAIQSRREAAHARCARRSSFCMRACHRPSSMSPTTRSRR